MNNLDVTLIQSHIAWHDIDANLDHFGRAILSLTRQTDLIVLPEMFTTGFTMEPAGIAEEMNGKTVSAMKYWSMTTGADITGSIIVSENGSYMNRLVWAKPHGSIITCDKRHLFRMAGEHEIFTAGSEPVIAELKGWKIMPAICYDLRFPVWLRNNGNRYDMLLICASWPASRQNHWDILLKARAIENQCYVAAVNRTGHDGKGVEYAGGSALIDFPGNLLASAGHENAVIHGTCAKESLDDYRRSFPAWMDADSFRLD